MMFAYFTEHLDGDKAWACFPDGDDPAGTWDKMIAYLHELAEQRDTDEEYALEIQRRILMADDCEICDHDTCPCRLMAMVQ